MQQHSYLTSDEMSVNAKQITYIPDNISVKARYIPVNITNIVYSGEHFCES